MPKENTGCYCYVCGIFMSRVIDAAKTTCLRSTKNPGGHTERVCRSCMYYERKSSAQCPVCKLKVRSFGTSWIGLSLEGKKLWPDPMEMTVEELDSFPFMFPDLTNGG
jgi:hypothetical protein